MASSINRVYIHVHVYIYVYKKKVDVVHLLKLTRGAFEVAVIHKLGQVAEEGATCVTAKIRCII